MFARSELVDEDVALGADTRHLSNVGHGVAVAYVLVNRRKATREWNNTNIQGSIKEWLVKYSVKLNLLPNSVLLSFVHFTYKGMPV